MEWADHFIDTNESPLLMQRYAYLDALNASLDPDQHTCYLREYTGRNISWTVQSFIWILQIQISFCMPAPYIIRDIRFGDLIRQPPHRPSDGSNMLEGVVLRYWAQWLVRIDLPGCPCMPPCSALASLDAQLTMAVASLHSGSYR